MTSSAFRGWSIGLVKKLTNKTDAKTTVVRTVKARVPAFIAAAQVATARPAYVN